jgi:hypothetical protein
MELLEIQSQHDMTAHVPESRRAIVRSYLVSCRQFMYVLGLWRKPNAVRGPAAGRGTTLSFMTLAADQIWITEEEITSIVAAIQSSRPQVSLA